MTHATAQWFYNRTLRAINFTPEEDEKILAGIRGKLSIEQIAKSLKRTKGQVKWHIQIKTSLRLAAMTAQDDKKIADRRDKAEEIKASYGGRPWNGGGLAL